jgi:hypothetical protein
MDFYQTKTQAKQKYIFLPISNSMLNVTPNLASNISGCVDLKKIILARLEERNRE